MEDLKLAYFTEGIINLIEGTAVECLIIDLRNNLGGNSMLLEPFIGSLEKCGKINKEGALYVIIGRDTFSSALLNAYAIKNKTKAVLVGEPSGGKPNCYGEVESFKLDNSKVKICYSSKYYKLVKNDRVMSLFPDVERLVTFKDYIEMRDPCLDYILQTAGKSKK
ncbi:MAG TPA: S41 family peptidase [Clostridiaceae bacterium]|nr:S41 family peptidase [Clostridiaceae bacterium]